MLFNSVAFAVFLPTVFAVYWLASGRQSLQNILLLAASYVFYGWWDVRFLSLIVLSTAVDYLVGIGLADSVHSRSRKRNLLLGISLATNLGLLGVFKYFNFFAESLAALAGKVGYSLDSVTLNIILPVGISFYTFQTLSYTLDVYRGQMRPTRDPVAFAAYVAFFPQLVAGPIERAVHLLPQFSAPKAFSHENAAAGMRQILWGLFKKVAVADTCALVVDDIFENYADYSSASLVAGGIFFAFQIYGDFSGYSDIAIGTAKLFGFSLRKNFAYPYFSRDIAEFWRRWHISLSTWFRDYLYFPLGGSRVSRPRAVRNIFIIFLVSGLWHGANWTFVFWGALNALYFVPLFVLKKNRVFIDGVGVGRAWPSLDEIVRISVTFGLTVLAWVFFRAESIGHALAYLSRILEGPLIEPLRFSTSGALLICVLITFEWLQRDREHGLDVPHWQPSLRRSAYLILVILITKTFGAPREFIYFQF